MNKIPTQVLDALAQKIYQELAPKLVERNKIIKEKFIEEKIVELFGSRTKLNSLLNQYIELKNSLLELTDVVAIQLGSKHKLKKINVLSTISTTSFEILSGMIEQAIANNYRIPELKTTPSVKQIKDDVLLELYFTDHNESLDELVNRYITKYL